MDRETVVRSVARTCRGPLSPSGAKAVSEALAEGRMPLAKMLDEVERTPCGHDINELILAHALDGRPKEEPCPGCGRLVRWVPVDLGEGDS